jgi:hypothetical protein
VHAPILSGCMCILSLIGDRKGVRSNWAGLGYWARSQCGGTRPHCGPPVRYLRIALRDKTLPHCGGKRPHCGKNRPQCGVKIDRTAVRDDRTVGRKIDRTAVGIDRTAVGIDRTDRPHCGECGATSTAVLCAPHCCGRQSSHRQPQGFSRARGPCLRLAQRGRALRLWLCPSETRSSLLDCGGPGATY